MKISIVIPSYNQGPFLEKTLLSVIDQRDADYELIVIDGGSTDESVRILETYSSSLAYWESTPDRGQTHAINKGLARITGDVWAYLNSDDLLVPGALAKVTRYFEDPSVDWLSGRCENFSDSGIIGGVNPGEAGRFKDYLSPWNRSEQYVFPFSGSCFMRRYLLDKIGFFDESFLYSMDIEYYCRCVFVGGIRQQIVPDMFARWRWHSNSKTMSKGIAFAFLQDEIRIAARYSRFLPEDQRQELEKELKLQSKWSPVREAMWLLNEGSLREAAWLLIEATAHKPSLLLFRPWLGAMRRLVYLGSCYRN